MIIIIITIITGIIIMPSVLYGVETWSMGVTDKKRLNMVMSCVQIMCGITWKDRVKGGEETRTKI